jgi:CheY-like chemotaxis protein
MAHILLVDDDELLRGTLQHMLELDGHVVAQAQDGCEALDRLTRGRFDLVITDVLMPRMDGAQFIIEARQRPECPPILAISGGRRVLTPSFNLQTAGLAGAVGQLAKPFGRAELSAAVQRALAA